MGGRAWRPRPGKGQKLGCLCPAWLAGARWQPMVGRACLPPSALLTHLPLSALPATGLVSLLSQRLAQWREVPSAFLERSFTQEQCE